MSSSYANSPDQIGIGAVPSGTIAISVGWAVSSIEDSALVARKEIHDDTTSFGCIAAVACVLAAQTAKSSSPELTTRSPTQPSERALLNQYCVTCHNQKLKTAGLELDKLDTAHVADHAEKWELVVRKLRSGMMPPSGMPRPAWTTYESMVDVA